MSLNELTKAVAELGLPSALAIATVYVMFRMIRKREAEYKEQMRKLEQRVTAMEKEIALCHLERLNLKAENTLLTEQREDLRQRVDTLNAIIIDRNCT